MQFGVFVLEELASLEREKSPSFHSLSSVAKKLGALVEVPASELTTRHVEATLRGIDSPGAQAKARMLIRRACRRGVAEGRMSKDPTDALPTIRVDRSTGRSPAQNAAEVLSIPDMRKLLAVKSRERGLWALLLTSGMRVAEAGAVQERDVTRTGDFASFVVRGQLHAKWHDIRETKTGNFREVVVPAWAMPQNLPIFDCSEALVLRWWHRDLALAGLAKRRIHATRHSFISVMVGLGVDPLIVKDMTHPRGRSDAFATYLHFGLEKKIEAANRLARALQGE